MMSDVIASRNNNSIITEIVDIEFRIGTKSATVLFDWKKLRQTKIKILHKLLNRKNAIASDC